MVVRICRHRECCRRTVIDGLRRVRRDRTIAGHTRRDRVRVDGKIRDNGAIGGNRVGRVGVRLWDEAVRRREKGNETRTTVTGRSHVTDGRFKGGWITRHFGQPQSGVHALQMELSNRGYMREPEEKGSPDNWPVPYEAGFAAPIRVTLENILKTAIAWAQR